MNLLFIHGSGFTGAAFDAQLTAFPGSAAPNLPGHDTVGSGASVAEFADFIEAYIMSNDLRNVVLCGNSLGGAIALEVGLRANPAVCALALVGSGSRLRVAPAFLEGLRDRFETTARMIAGYLYADPTPARIDEACSSMRIVGQAQTLRDYLACDAFDVTERLGELALPVLALTGESDKMTPPKYAQALADRVAGAQTRILPGAGHLAMIESPSDTNQALINFVAGL
ncbi:MAG: alpha/beta hydrolase [Candidatus Eremiobacteraeota bacterium]|nr:alpha/beta hydrolase [Candidatus Eremiobacteraeota bacterium]